MFVRVVFRTCPTTACSGRGLTGAAEFNRISNSQGFFNSFPIGAPRLDITAAEYMGLQSNRDNFKIILQFCGDIRWNHIIYGIS